MNACLLCRINTKKVNLVSKLTPLVSIVVPVYNVEKYLERCLDSCFSQSYVNIEVLAVNDGSTDSSIEILKRYAMKELRLKIFDQSNVGVAVARNIGISMAEGEWVVFVDSDDYIPNYAVEKLLNSAFSENADIVMGKLCFDKRGKYFVGFSALEYGSCKEVVACALLTEKLPLSLCGKIFRISLFEGIKIISQLKIGEDAYMVIQLCEKAENIVLIDDSVYYYYQRFDSVMHRPSSEAVASRLLFIGMTANFYSGCEYSGNINFINAMDYFIMKECFAYLTTGGSYEMIPKEMRDELNNKCLNNSVATISLRFWRIMMLKAYKCSPLLGDFYNFFFQKIKLLVR